MLTDIFAYRYLDHPIWQNYTELEKRLLVQAFGIVKDALPYYTTEGKVDKDAEKKWKDLHDKLARELGVKELSKLYYSYVPQGYTTAVSGSWSWDYVCEQFVTETYSGQYDADRFIKERISFIELALRQAGQDIALSNAFYNSETIRAFGRMADNLKSEYGKKASNFESLILELNERFRRVKAPLTYHNGFIQLSSDQQAEKNIGKPFWETVADPLWKNVDIDMKEALDQRDSNGKDPALYAAKALESTIKIISDKKGWSQGTEKGAANYIDNLVSKKNGRYIEAWEGDILKAYFSKVRNPLGHGPGSNPMPKLNLSQTDWAIESAMSWIRSLVRRME